MTCLKDSVEEELSEGVDLSHGSRKRLFSLRGIYSRSK